MTNQGTDQLTFTSLFSRANEIVTLEPKKVK